jgi:hypothetical protein
MYFLLVCSLMQAVAFTACQVKLDVDIYISVDAEYSNGLVLLNWLLRTANGTRMQCALAPAAPDWDAQQSAPTYTY